MSERWPRWYRVVNQVLRVAVLLAGAWAIVQGAWSSATFFLVAMLDLSRQIEADDNKEPKP